MLVVVIVTAATFAFLVFVLMVMTAAAFAFAVMMFVTVAATTATAFFFIMVMVVAAAAATALFFFVVMVMTAATAAALFFIVVMVMATATAAAFFFIVMVVTAAAATAATTATATVTRHGQGFERFFNFGNGQAHAFEHFLKLGQCHNGKTVFGLSHAKTACQESINGFLHERHIARNLQNGFGSGFDLVEAAGFVDQHVAHFQGTHFAETVFDFRFTHLKGFGQTDAFDHRQGNALSTINQSLSGSAVGREEFRNTHRFNHQS